MMLASVKLEFSDQTSHFPGDEGNWVKREWDESRWQTTLTLTLSFLLKNSAWEHEATGGELRALLNGKLKNELLKKKSRCLLYSSVVEQLLRACEALALSPGAPLLGELLGTVSGSTKV